MDRFKQFLWRPRPRTLLTKEQQRQIRRNLREYSRVFEEEDSIEQSNLSAELIAQRKRLVDEWNAWRIQCKEEIAEERRKNGALALGTDEKHEEKEEIEVWIEKVIEQTEEEVKE